MRPLQDRERNRSTVQTFEQRTASEREEEGRIGVFMSLRDLLNRRGKRVSVPRWATLLLFLFIFAVVFPFGHAGIPWMLSRLTPRYGWTHHGPGAWNLLGLIPVVGGTFGLIWVFVAALQDFHRVPKRIILGLTPPYLVVRGPYAVTRHPMYVVWLASWFGWALFYGSIANLAGSIVVLLWVNFIVPREERALEMAFGQTYLDYSNKVPRWFGKPSGRV
jgi:protein-S-isoprenylcysteine O-methyltransferase Ste14